MADRELTPEEMRAVELLMQLQALSPQDAATAVRATLRMPDGSYVGEALLSENAVAALTDATLSMVAYRDAQMPQAPAAAMDSLAVGDFEKYFTRLDVDDLVDMARVDPKAAVAAFDKITGFGMDGDVL